MKMQQVASQPPLSECELAPLDLAGYAHYPEQLFLHAIVQRGAFWHTALLIVDRGKLKHSAVNPKRFRREADARNACQQEHERMQYLFKMALPDFDIRPVWFK
jgi:hypothetical protein